MSYFVFYCCLLVCKLLWVIYLGLERKSLSVCSRLLVIMWFLFEEVTASSWCLGWAALFYCGTPCAFYMTILV